MIGELFALSGAILMLLSAIGVMRFDDVLARMHALSKASTMGVLLVLTGAVIALHDPIDTTSVILAVLAQLLTSPPAENMLSRATYLAEGIPTPSDMD